MLLVGFWFFGYQGEPVSPDSNPASATDNVAGDADMDASPACAGDDECGDTIIAEARVPDESLVDNYNKSCATCHNAGIAGAPLFGNTEQWAARIEKGREVLYESSINGLPPTMPAKGMCFSCSDDELRALVDYMLDAAK